MNFIRKPQLTLLLTLSALMVVSFQNCSKVQFSAVQLSSQNGKLDTEPTMNSEDLSSDAAQDLPPAPEDLSLAPQPILPEQAEESDEPADYDHIGRKIRFGCTSGANSVLDFSEDLSTSDDLNLTDSIKPFGAIFNKARNVSIDGLYSANFKIKAAERVILARDIRVGAGRVYAKQIDLVQDFKAAYSAFRSLDVQRFEDVHGAVTSLASSRIGSVEDVRAGVLCLSGQEIERVYDIKSAFIKLVGRSDGASKAHMGLFSRIRGLASLANLNIDRIDDVEGLVVIRGGEVADIQNFKGRLALIGTKVGKISNFSGHIYLKDSQIGSVEGEAPQMFSLK